MFYFALLLPLVAASLPCYQTDVRKILEGCNVVRGLTLISAGGTVVDDHNCDVLLPKQVFAEEPVIIFSNANNEKFYTVIVVDPDAPPKIRGEFFLHMIKSNVPGSVLKNTDNSKTTGIDYRAYVSPAPPFGSGEHRYFFLLYEQPDGNNFIAALPSSRYHFNLERWLRGKRLCGPVAGTLFRAQFSEMEPIRFVDDFVSHF